MNHKRPVNLDLGSLKFPPMAIVSILHRISGVILFLLMPLMLYILKLSLSTPESFNQLQIWVQCFYLKFFLWVFSAALVYHLIAGIRHIFMDFGLGEELNDGRKSSVFVLILASILTILLGIWIW